MVNNLNKNKSDEKSFIKPNLAHPFLTMATLLKENMGVLFFFFNAAPPSFLSTLLIIIQFKEVVTFYLRVRMSWGRGHGGEVEQRSNLKMTFLSKTDVQEQRD